MPKQSVALDIEGASPRDLHFDERNPRLKGRSGEASSQDEIMTVLWRDFAVDELALSIAANGFFPYEPIFVADEVVPSLDMKGLVVIEGNRRLAAIRLLLDPNLRRQLKATDLPVASATIKRSLQEVPIVRCKRDEIWRFVGFKHVNGPQQWDALAKAEYIAWVHNEVGESLPAIARQIGDRHSTVQRLYHALMALRQGEEAGVYDREQRYNKRFFFSHLYTGLGYAGIQSYLGMSSSKAGSPTKTPIPRKKLEEFGNLCLWLYGDREDGIQPVVKRQNPDLRMLDEVLQSKSGVTALESGLGLTVSVDLAKGDDRILRESLIEAKSALQIAKARVVTGYHGEPEALSTAEDVQLLGASIVEEMRSSSSRTRSRTRKQ